MKEKAEHYKFFKVYYYSITVSSEILHQRRLVIVFVLNQGALGICMFMRSIYLSFFCLVAPLLFSTPRISTQYYLPFPSFFLHHLCSIQFIPEYFSFFYNCIQPLVSQLDHVKASRFMHVLEVCPRHLLAGAPTASSKFLYNL